MKLVLPILSFVFIGLLTTCGTPKIRQMDTLTTFEHPESVSTDANYIYVTNFGAALEPQKKDNDGYISRYRLNGELMENRFISKLSAPKGTVIHQGVLYVADIDHLRGFDVENGEPIFDISFEGESTFLNGLCVEDETHLFVSATDRGKIYRVDLEKQTYEVLGIPGLKGPNGLDYDAASKTLYVVGFGTNNKPNGKLGKVSFNPTSYQNISDYEGMLDGAVLTGEWLYFTDWKSFEPEGVFLKYNLKTREIIPVKGAPLMAGPADFTFSKDGKFAIIPTLLGQKVVTVKL